VSISAHIQRVDAACSALPAALRDVIAPAIVELKSAQPDWSELPADCLDALPRVWACSDFVSKTCLARPGLLAELASSGDLFRPYEQGELRRRVQDRLAEVQDEEQLLTALRHLRLRESVRVAWRDLAGDASLDEVMALMTELGEACIENALAHLYRWYCDERGTPVGEHSGQPVQLVVLGLGKLGGGELNFSSDVDLIFTYSEEGETRAERSISNHEFFTKLGRRLIHVLETPTPDGQTFRVDMRLRPNGNSGPIVLSFEATEHYYQTHGRDWERYAWIKARPVAGDLAAGRSLLRDLRPFVYRKYLDFGAVEAIRDMKELIERELKRKGASQNIKLGRGGIREIEFIAQSFQLIRGGRDLRLQTHQLFAALDALRAAGVLDEETVNTLHKSYIFLRRTEHRLQMLADQQTHQLPSDPVAQARIAFASGGVDWETFAREIGSHRDAVHACFQTIFAPAAPASSGIDPRYADLWRGQIETVQAHEWLTQLGYRDATASWDQIVALRHSKSYQVHASSGRERLDRLMPLLIRDAAATAQPDETLKRVIVLLEAVARRPTYLILLLDSELARTQLVTLCATSAWIANWISRVPMLLDELLDPISAQAGASVDELDREMHERLSRIDAGDLEFQMDALRELRHAAVMKVAAADVSGLLDVIEVGHRLSGIAETTLKHTLNCAIANLAPQIGTPAGGAQPGIVAYGKLGSMELGYHSDLDLVFLYPAAQKSGSTTGGERTLGNEHYYGRLVQRVVHILTTRTPAGLLYDIDMRLRPSGRAGTLITTLEGFTGYQSEQAWTWEHQALVRARLVAGPDALRREFEAIRESVLVRERDPQRLTADIREMRDKMVAANDRSSAVRFDLKQGRGGMIDIEFLVQYYVLRWAHQHPELTRPRTNLEILAALVSAGVIPPERQRALDEAYRKFLATEHRLKLAEAPALVDNVELSEPRAAVIEAWSAEFS